MGKMSLSLPDSLIKMIEAESEKLGENKSQVATQAIEFWFSKGKALEENLHTAQNQLVEAQKALGLKENEFFLQSKKLRDLENQLEETQKIVGKKEEGIDDLEKEVLTLRKELQEAQKFKDQLESNLQIRADEISFLRGHIAQLTQMAQQQQLPPSQEEAKRKHWYQFWR